MTKYTLIPIVDPVSNLANTSAKAIPATVINSAPNKSIQEGVWIERGQTVVVAGVSITGGFFYFGEKLGEETWREENCLVRPSLKVAATSRWTGEPMSYYPSYSTISPEFRLGYLQWLASERSDPNTNIGFVYLYFYGIEYYVFKKKIGNKRIELITEAKRLLTIYTQNAHFVRYVRQFIAAVEIEDKNYLVQPQIRIESGYHTEMPLHTRLYLGDLLTRKQPFSKDDALIWLAGTTGNSFRSPAVRCAV